MIVGDSGGRRAHVIVAGYRHELRPVGDHLRSRLGAFHHVRLGVRHDTLDLLAQDSALSIEILDCHHRAVQRRPVIGAHPTALGDGKADDDIISRRRPGNHRSCHDGNCGTRHE